MDAIVSLPVLLATVIAVIFLLYRLALPKPLPGIPYNVSATRSIFGDILAIQSHIKRTKGSFVTYMSAAIAELDSPLVQLFVRPLAGNPPMLVLADARETQDVLLRRGRQFDRSPSMGDLAMGLAPGHHLLLRTEDPAFKSQRRLVQDLMAPSFLHGIAGPVIYGSTQVMIDLWRVKCRAARGRPFKAEHDLSNVVMDAITAFAFGEAFRMQHSTTRAALAAVLCVPNDAAPRGVGEPMHFPSGTVDDVCQAILDLTYTVGDLQGNPLPKITWAYVMRKPRIRRAWRIKEDFFRRELRSAGERIQGPEQVRCAVDHMVLREKELAEKQEREPDFLSRVMIDEIFGFVFAGHETTSTTLSWGVKFLADHPAVQTRLRHALRSSYKSGPTFDAISSTRVPHLDAVLEEVVRCGATAPIVDRVALVDTELLGHFVPKGTIVTFLANGPSMGSPGFSVEEKRRSPTSRDKSNKPKDRCWNPHDIGVFKPERWLVPKLEALAEGGDQALQDVEFDGAAGPQLGFGLGTRGCFGMRLAKLQMKIVLALVVWNFECVPCPPELSGYEPELIGVNKPTQCYVKLREIEHN